MNPYQTPLHTGGATISTRLAARMMDELKQGRFAECEKLPSELELCELYGVSRSVIRDTLSDLEREGLIQRGRGIGTVINRQIVNLKTRFDLKLEYAEVIRGAGYVPSADRVHLAMREADEAVAESLQLDLGEPLLACEKRVLASGKPVIFSVDYLPLRLFEGVDYQALNWAGSVFDLLETHCGIVVDTDIASVSPTNGPQLVRTQLELEAGEALLYIDEVGYQTLRRPVLYTQAYYTGFFNLSVLRKKF